MHDCLNCQHPCVEYSDEKVKIHGKLVLACAYQGTLPNGVLSDIMIYLQGYISDAQNQLSLPKASQDLSLNNIRGTWTQYIFSSLAWNYFAAHPHGNSCFVHLPSISTLRFIDLFDPDASAALKNGLLDRLESQGVTLSISNPDFLCIRDVYPEDMLIFREKICNLSLDSQERMDSAYKNLLHSCSYSSLRYGIALKTSLRSDRRYQVAYEGSVLKALIAHLQVRFWDVSFETKYYTVVANKVGPEDRRALTAPATHSIVDVHTPPIKAVDEIFEVRSTQDIIATLQTIEALHNS